MEKQQYYMFFLHLFCFFYMTPRGKRNPLPTPGIMRKQNVEERDTQSGLALSSVPPEYTLLFLRAHLDHGRIRNYTNSSSQRQGSPCPELLFILISHNAVPWVQLCVHLETTVGVGDHPAVQVHQQHRQRLRYKEVKQNYHW